MGNGYLSNFCTYGAFTLPETETDTQMSTQNPIRICIVICLCVSYASHFFILLGINLGVGQYKHAIRKVDIAKNDVQRGKIHYVTSLKIIILH